MNSLLKSAIVGALTLACTGSLLALSTNLTFSGRLNDLTTGAPLNGNYDFTFTVWTSTNGPAQVGGTLTNLNTAVSGGLFTGMPDFGEEVITNGAARWLEIAVRTNGPGAFTLLSPRQQLSAVPYAVAAGTVIGLIHGGSIVNGSITSAQLAPGAVTAANLANNSITAGQLASGAAAANLNAASQSGVASGGLLLSALENAPLVNAGYVRIGATTTADTWLPRTNGANTASGRDLHTAVWTGTEMIVWGGEGPLNPSFLNDGARYNPAANSWTALPSIGAPAGRKYHTAVWTGTEMIVWGGFGPNTTYNTGGRYDPATDKWTAVPINGAPAARNSHTAVWTGTEMIVWGGYGNGFMNDGGRYKPAADSWNTPFTTVGAPAGRIYHTAVWTGTEMIVWGGEFSVGGFLNDGGRYNPVADHWNYVTNVNTLAARIYHTAVWTGTEMIIWGGQGAGNLNDGGRYNPAGDSWAAVSPTGAPAKRFQHTAVWTGSEMIVWGGQGAGYLNDGGRYYPVGNSWTPIVNTLPNTPAARSLHSAVWTGTEMIVWGGTDGGNRFNDTFSFTPGRTMLIYQRP